MAAPAPSDKIKDKEYTNWLKVTLALYYMKSGLHTFIQSEINYLHQSLINKIYGGQMVPLPPCTMCHASHVKRNKYTGVWAFQKQCRSFCDVWLDELLALHTNPKSEKIYWNNTDVPKWPFNPWQCAKVFMPRGQLPSSTGPAECDVQALMTLLSNCTHFHHKLSPSGQSLTHDISTMRNKVMHDGEMKLSDTDRKNFIQQIIQLLEDPVSLKSTEDCKAAIGYIHKIDNDSLDVFIDVGLEITALRETVNELRQELGIQEKGTVDTIDSLKEECKNLREQLTKRFEDVEKELELHKSRMDTIERDVETVKEKTDTVLQQQEKKLQELHTTVTSEQTKRLEDVETRMDSIERYVETVKEQTDTVLHQQEKKHQEMHTAVTQLSETLYARVASQDVRLIAVEENVSRLHTGQRTKKNKSCRKVIRKERRQRRQETDGRLKKTILSETPPERRPESGGLRQLKSRTEDKLDTFRRLECIPTTQAEKAKKLLEDKRSVVIKGNPGEGKTTMALHLIDNEIYRDRHVVVYSPRDWEMVDTDCVDIIVMEDIFGQYNLDPGRLQEWMVYLPTIQEHVDAGKLQVIITTRVDVLSKAYSKLGLVKLFSGDLSLMLSSEKLEKSEKMGILNRELQRYTRNMKQNDKEKCIDNFSGFIGFPQCCSLFAGDDNLFNRGSEFFRSPEKYFIVNINTLEDTRFLSLAFLFCSGKIFEEDLSPETMPESRKCFLIKLASYLNISENKASIILLRDAYDIFLGFYVVKSISCKPSFSLSFGKPYIQFSHATVYEAVGHALGYRCVEMIVKHGIPEYLYQRTYAAEAKDIMSQNVFLPVSVYKLLAERMVRDVVKKKICVRSLVKHSALKQNQFLVKLEAELLKKCNRTKKFLKPHSNQFSSIHFSDQSFQSLQGSCEAYCETFLQCILQADADTVRVVYSKFLKFLACMHENTPDCWKCNEKQTLLELALYYHHFEIADKLISMNACYTQLCLCNASRHNDLRRVQTILESLKMKKTLSTKCEMAKKALCNAYISGNQSIIDFLLKEGIALDSKYVQDVVQMGNVNALLKVVEHLRYHNKWLAHWEEDIADENFSYLDCLQRYKTYNFRFSTTLYLAYINDKLDMADCLAKHGVKVSICMLKNVLRYSQQAVATLIQHLKDADSWEPKCVVACKALENVFSEQKYDLCDLLIQEGVSLRMDSLPHVFAFEKSLMKAIQHLKVTGNWSVECDDASEALKSAYIEQRYAACDLLIKEGITLRMKNFRDLIIHRGSFECVKKAIQHLKHTGNWYSKCDVASEALEKAYSQQNAEVYTLLIDYGVSLTMKNMPGVIHRTSLETVEKAVKNLKDAGNWDPKCGDASKALADAFRKRKHDVCDLLFKEGVSLTMETLLYLINYYDQPHASLPNFPDWAEKVVQHLKDTGSWNSKCDAASKALEKTYWGINYGLCHLLIDNGVSLTMNNFLGVIKYGIRYGNFVETAEQTVSHLKHTGNWNPKCDAASKVLEIAYRFRYDLNYIDSEIECDCTYHVCDLLIQEGVSLPLKNLPGIIKQYKLSSESAMKTIQHLKDTGNWYPKCDDASKALEYAYIGRNYDLCNLLIHEGVSLTMKNLPDVICECILVYTESLEPATLEVVMKAIQHLKDIGNWDPMCDDASKALEQSFCKQNFDVCDLLMHDGVSLTMKNLPGVICVLKVSLETAEKAIQNLEDTGIWNPRCDDASEALKNSFCNENYDVCNLLICKSISLTMKILPGVIDTFSNLDMNRKAIQHLKATGNWDPKCDDASKALAIAFSREKYDMCDLLVKDGVLLTMKNLPGVLDENTVSLVASKNAVQYIKDTGNWDPKCDDASKALEIAFTRMKYAVCDLLIQYGVLLTMKNLPGIVDKCTASLVASKNAVQYLKDTGNWDPTCDDASKALEIAFTRKKYDVCDILFQDGVSLTMKNLSCIVGELTVSLETAKNALQHMKDTGKWNPKCDDASKALEIAYGLAKYDVYDLLIQEGISLTVKTLPWWSLESVTKAIQFLKATDNWDPKCDDASRALKNAYSQLKYDVCDLLIQEGVLLAVKTFPWWSLKSVTKATQFLKDAGSWDPKCDDVSKALINAYIQQNFDVCDLLIQEGVSLRVKALPWWSLESITKAIQFLKGTGNWDPRCDDASRALENASAAQYYNVWDLLIQEGVAITVKTLPFWSLESVTKAVQCLRGTGNWDPKCDDVCRVLKNAYTTQNYDVCDLLVQEGAPLTMESFSFFYLFQSSFSLKKLIKLLKITNHWDPSSQYAGFLLAKAQFYQRKDICELLTYNGVCYPETEDLDSGSEKSIVVATFLSEPETEDSNSDWDPTMEDMNDQGDFICDTENSDREDWD